MKRRLRLLTPLFASRTRLAISFILAGGLALTLCQENSMAGKKTIDIQPTTSNPSNVEVRVVVMGTEAVDVLIGWHFPSPEGSAFDGECFCEISGSAAAVAKRIRCLGVNAGVIALTTSPSAPTHSFKVFEWRHRSKPYDSHVLWKSQATEKIIALLATCATGLVATFLRGFA